MDAAGLAHLVERSLPILLPILPSIVVGATKYPKASKALQVVSHILQFFSVLSHKDADGTFKAPGKVDRCGSDEDDEPAVRERPGESSEEPSEGASTAEVEFLRALVLRLLDGYTPPRSYLR